MSGYGDFGFGAGRAYLLAISNATEIDLHVKHFPVFNIGLGGSFGVCLMLLAIIAHTMPAYNELNVVEVTKAFRNSAYCTPNAPRIVGHDAMISNLVYQLRRERRSRADV